LFLSHISFILNILFLRQNVNSNGIQFMKRNLTGYQFGIYWTRLNVNTALSSSNGNVCITLSIQNIERLDRIKQKCINIAHMNE
jgi:hypothetical protein